MTPVIETEGLTRGFRSGLAVDGLSFTLEAGQVLALLGPNGAGKTTTVRLLDGVLLPHAGRSRVLGHDPATDGDAVRRRTGVLTENAGLDDRLTSRENLLYVARLRGYGKQESRRRVDELLERFGMASRRDDLTGGFSTGQRKRVALARALLHDPELLFLDEPTSGLDPAGTRDVISLIDELAAEGRTVVLATHFLGEAGRLADRMAVLHHGRLRAFGAPRELAAELWSGVGAELDLGGPADAATMARLSVVPGVRDVEAHGDGARLVLDDRDALPRAVVAAVEAGVPVYGAATRVPSLEDVYFAIERRIAEEEGALQTDGFTTSGSSGSGPVETVAPPRNDGMCS
jgi:ABC-2 type transport system ATP-binding protein